MKEFMAKNVIKNNLVTYIFVKNAQIYKQMILWGKLFIIKIITFLWKKLRS